MSDSEDSGTERENGQGVNVLDLALGPNGCFVAITKGFPSFWGGCNDNINRLLKGNCVVTVAFSGAKNFYIGYSDGTFVFNLHRELAKLIKQDSGAKWIAFGPQESYIYRGSNGQLRWWGISPAMTKKINEKKWSVKWATLGRGDSWLVMFEDGSYWRNELPAQLEQYIWSQKVSKKAHITSLDRVWLSAYDDRYYLEYNGGAAKWHTSSAYFACMMACDDMIPPDQIFYTQDSISATFRDGKSIYDTARDVNKGWVEITAIPAIEVYNHNGGYYSVNNRRLWVFRNSGVQTVPVKIIKAPVTIPSEKMSHIYVRYRE